MNPTFKQWSKKRKLRISGQLIYGKQQKKIRLCCKVKKSKINTLQNHSVEMEDTVDLTLDNSLEERAHSSEGATGGSPCDNCTMKYESRSYLEAHLHKVSNCFWPLTKRYWYKSPDKSQTCSVCNQVLENALALKRHCYFVPECKIHYLKSYFEDTANQNNSLHESLDTDTTVSLASTSGTHANPRPVAYTVSSSSSTLTSVNNNRNTASVAEVVEGTSNEWRCSFCEKKCKLKRALKCHITRMHTPKNTISLNASQSFNQGSSLRSRKSFACEKCSTPGYKRGSFIYHVLTSRACLKYYEDPRHQSLSTLRYCFRCKTNHKRIKESVDHRCSGTVLENLICPICKQNLHTIGALKKHIKNVHNF